MQKQLQASLCTLVLPCHQPTQFASLRKLKACQQRNTLVALPNFAYSILTQHINGTATLCSLNVKCSLQLMGWQFQSETGDVFISTLLIGK
jgi:hypothetical protein